MKIPHLSSNGLLSTFAKSWNKGRWKNLTIRGKGRKFKFKEIEEEQKQHINEMSKPDGHFFLRKRKIYKKNSIAWKIESEHD